MNILTITPCFCDRAAPVCTESAGCPNRSDSADTQFAILMRRVASACAAAHAAARLRPDVERGDVALLEAAASVGEEWLELHVTPRQREHVETAG